MDYSKNRQSIGIGTVLVIDNIDGIGMVVVSSNIDGIGNW